MLGQLSHIAIAVSNLEQAIIKYRDVLGAKVSKPIDLPDHGVTSVFVELPNTKIELLTPLGTNSPISSFLKKHPDGGIHHVCFQVTDIMLARERLIKQGMRILGNGDPQPGAHNKLVLFLHPKDFAGTLIELEQA